MGEPPDKKVFNQEDRTRLRAALIAYMKDHDIGVPTLHARIAQAAGRHGDLLPLKTLQRFLAGTTRTNDALLSHCFQFAENVAPKAGLEAFTDAALTFFERDQCGEAGTALTGRWSGSAASNKTGISVMRTATGEDLTSAETSEMTIAANGSGLHIRETVTNPAATRTAKYDAGFRHSYEGIVLAFEPLICVLLKNMATRLPRTYWLQMADDQTLAGHGAEGIFEAGPMRVVTDLAAFRFERAAEGDVSDG